MSPRNVREAGLLCMNLDHHDYLKCMSVVFIAEKWYGDQFTQLPVEHGSSRKLSLLSSKNNQLSTPGALMWYVA